MSGVLATQTLTFLLAVCRAGAAVMLLPGLGETQPPLMLRMGLTLALALLLTPALGAVPLPAAPFDLARLVIGELLAGAVLGFLARLIALALPAAGQIISAAIGLSSALLPDTVLGASNPILGGLLGLAVPVIVLSTGLYALPLTALAGSYDVFPVGFSLPAGDLVQFTLRGVSASFALAVRLAAPFLVAGLLWQAGLGLLARLIPQLQVYFASLPGQILGGLLLLGALAASLLDVWAQAARVGFERLPGL